MSTLLDLRWEPVRWVTRIVAALRMSTDDLQSTASIDFGDTNPFWGVGKFISTEFTNNTDQP